MTKVVIDRFEGAFAVLILGEDNDRLQVPRASLPAEAKEGDWLQVEFQDETVISAVIDSQEATDAKKRIADKLALLRSGAHLKNKADKP